MHRFIMATRYMASASLLGVFGAVHDDEDGETLGLIELDTSLSDVEKPKELPPGNYTGEIQDVQMGTSQKGNSYFNIKFVISPSEIPADMQDDFEDGCALYYNRIIVPKKGDRRALFNLKNFIEKLGLDTNTTQIDPNEWMGQSARLKVVHGTWQGEKRAEIKSIESAEAPSGKKKAVVEEKAPPARGARGRK